MHTSTGINSHKKLSNLNHLFLHLEVFSTRYIIKIQNTAKPNNLLILKKMMNTINFEMIKLLVMLQEILDKFVFTQ